jgi:hypothetical protein
MQFKGNKQNTLSKIQKTKQKKTKPLLQEKRNVKVLGINPYNLTPGNKSLIKVAYN